MQPYLFPYIGYWQLINAVDTFVVYDNIQFSKKGWFHRNNILLNGEKSFFTIPLKKDSDYLDVKDRFIADNSEKQIKKIVIQIQNAYKKSPFFDDVFPVIQMIFSQNEKNLFNYIYVSIINILKYLDINTDIIISSNINIDHALKSQKKVIAINKFMHADIYINSIGGTELYNKKEFEKENIKLLFIKSQIPEYKQFNNNFIPNLSIIDIMMFNSRKEIKKMLCRYELV